MADPFAPVIIGSVNTPGEAQDVAIDGMRAYVADGTVGGLQIIDISVPTAPSILGGVVTPGLTSGVDVSGTLAVVSDFGAESAVRVIDVSDPANPQILGTLFIGGFGAVVDLVVRGNRAYVAAFGGGFRVVDFTDPATPQPVGLVSSIRPFDVALSGQFALAADGSFFSTLPIVDIGDPGTTLLRTIMDFSAFGEFEGIGIAVTPQFAYMTGADDAILIGVNGRSQLFIGQYRSLEDLDGVPPTVAITAPLAGVTVFEAAMLSVTVDASDDVAVAAVEFLVDGQRAFTDTVAPFEFMATVPVGVSGLTFGAVAVDFGGNRGSAAEVAVNVVPDPLTTVQGQVVDRDGFAIGGADVACLENFTTTVADGTFSIAGLPTVKGDIVCVATALDLDGRDLVGMTAVPPVIGGITDIEVIARPLGSQGVDFWVIFPRTNSPPFGSAVLTILSRTTTDFAVNATGFSTSGTVTAGIPEFVPLPSTLRPGPRPFFDPTFVEDKGIHVTSDDDISVLLRGSAGLSRGVYAAIATPALGTEYFVFGIEESLFGGASFNHLAQFHIVATEDNTNVTVVPSCGGFSGGDPGVPLEFVMNAGQDYLYLCDDDPTGTVITSDKPVAVIVGNSFGCIPTDSGDCDALWEMLLPSSLYGTDHFVVPPSNSSPNLVSIMGVEDNTTVSVDDGTTISPFILDRAVFQELSIVGAIAITSDKPVGVVHYTLPLTPSLTSEPVQVQILPTSLASRTHDVQGFSSESSFVTIVAPNSATSSVTLNGLPVTGFVPLPGGTHQFVEVAIPQGQSSIDAGEPVLVYVYGVDSGTAIGYPGGF